MHADGEKKNSEFIICVNLRHLRAKVFFVEKIWTERRGGGQLEPASGAAGAKREVRKMESERCL
jgi:hypothetical protein